ncbi:hypothetical protein SUGI_0021540 [Cryptomeria japonica]|nr:hypothetical protein SUGI_0021540 [Cryptomeria japonica]
MSSADRPSKQERDRLPRLKEKRTEKFSSPDTLKTVIKFNNDDVNKSAEEFIAKFHRDLEIERLKSLERYEEMLNRGT